MNVDIIAVYGAVTGTIGTVLAVLNYRRDRAKLKISIIHQRKLLNAAPQYKANTLYTCVNIANAGRRPITITNVGFSFISFKGGAVLSDSMVHGSREIFEGKSADFLMDEEGINQKEIAYFYVIDGVGKQYKKFVSPRHKYYWHFLLDKSGIKRKKSRRHS